MYSKKVSGHAFSATNISILVHKRSAVTWVLEITQKASKNLFHLLPQQGNQFFFSLKDIDTRWHVHFVVSNYRSQKLHHKEI